MKELLNKNRLDWPSRCRVLSILVLFIFLVIAQGCNKMVQVDAPVTSLTSANVFSTDATAASALTGIYAKLSNGDGSMTSGSLTSMSFYPALSADELTLYDSTNNGLTPYYRNQLTSQDQPNSFWVSIYSYLYYVNAAIEGLNAATGMTPAVKRQLLGEATFMRALFYFYLTNLYGEVPLAVSSNFKINASLSRSSVANVYQQIITDLKEATGLLNVQYLQPDAETPYPAGQIQRVRPTKWAANALLAKAYLYQKDWVDAEAQADSVIANSTLFSLTGLDSVFLANSMETIWALQPVNTGTSANTGEGSLFILPPTGPNASGNYPVFLSNSVLSSFETGDQRRSDWVDSVIVGPTVYYYPYKYKIGAVNTNTQEYVMMQRLGELYLIRAEARAEQGNTQGAESDLNAIRQRAGLPGISTSDQVALLQTILHERQVELFTEWGNRWFDLIRTGNVNSVMGTQGDVCAAKGGNWSPDWQLYPIPQSEITLDANLSQNNGY